VSHEEWLQLWADCTDAILTKREFPYWLSAYMSFMFDAADTSGIYHVESRCVLLVTAALMELDTIVEKSYAMAQFIQIRYTVRLYIV